MIYGIEKRKRQLAFELQNSHVCEKRSKCQRLHRSQVTSNGQEKNRRSSVCGPINYPVSKLFAVDNRVHDAQNYTNM